MSTLAAQRRVIPGFGLSLGYTVMYLSLVILVPLGAVFIKSSKLEEVGFWQVVTSFGVMSGYFTSIFASLMAALINVPLGVLVAWVLVRYSFPGRRLLDSIVDLPFALPTAVAGIALSTLYSERGWIGAAWAKLGLTYPWPVWNGFDQGGSPILIKWFSSVAKAPLGVSAALVFIGLPFIVRTLQPVLEDVNRDVEEAAASLGANRWQTFYKVVLPQLWPAIGTGFALAFARGLGEFGSVVFITGGNPDAEIAPEQIIQRLEAHEYEQATAIAVGLLVLSFAMLLVINLLQRWAAKRQGT